ncbi:hypothetical protein FACS189418_2670 [Clostridia bacterium]|nr:hypothetical protein FACS189418_2670 [Clostridia bacterium]
MSDYKRLISYVHMYQNHNKGKNVGFVKLETIRGQCKLALNLKSIPNSTADFEVFLYSAEHEIKMGKIYIRNGQGELRLITDQNNLVHSGIPFSKVGGLKIKNFTFPEIYYATVWDDHLVNPENLSSADKQEEELFSFPDEAKQADESQILPIEEVQAAQIAISLDSPELEQKNPLSKNIIPENLDEEEKTLKKETKETSKINMENLANQLIDELSQELEKEEESVLISEEEESPLPFFDPTFHPETEEAQQTTEKIVISDSENKTTAKTDENTAKENRNFPVETPPENNESTHEQKPTLSSENDLDLTKFQESSYTKNIWENLKEQFSSLEPLSIEEKHEVLSLKPQDIGLLPRELWLFGNNSYLLHGYYQYRYLVLIRLEDYSSHDLRIRYFLGVPGVYQNHERFMAAMFGFSQFYLAKTSTQASFGYWCTEIFLP